MEGRVEQLVYVELMEVKIDFQSDVWKSIFRFHVTQLLLRVIKGPMIIRSRSIDKGGDQCERVEVAIAGAEEPTERILSSTFRSACGVEFSLLVSDLTRKLVSRRTAQRSRSMSRSTVPRRCSLLAFRTEIHRSGKNRLHRMAQDRRTQAEQGKRTFQKLNAENASHDASTVV